MRTTRSVVQVVRFGRTGHFNHLHDLNHIVDAFQRHFLLATDLELVILLLLAIIHFIRRNPLAVLVIGGIGEFLEDGAVDFTAWSEARNSYGGFVVQ